jgi:hypothetical protein
VLTLLLLEKDPPVKEAIVTSEGPRVGIVEMLCRFKSFRAHAQPRIWGRRPKPPNINRANPFRLCNHTPRFTNLTQFAPPIRLREIKFRVLPNLISRVSSFGVARHSANLLPTKSRQLNLCVIARTWLSVTLIRVSDKSRAPQFRGT